MKALIAAALAVAALANIGNAAAVEWHGVKCTTENNWCDNPGYKARHDTYAHGGVGH